MKNTVPVAVIIPAHRRVEKLMCTLERVHACDPSPETVTVHVDGGSEEVCEAVRRRFPEVSLMVSEALLGPGGARDKMIRQSRHEWVATFDDDSYPETPDFFAHAMEDARSYPDAAVLSWDTLSEEKAARGFHHIAVFSGCGSVFNRSWYLSTRGFLPRVVAYGFEEVDVSLQLHCLGGRVLYDPRLRVVHDHPMTEGVPLEIMAGAVMNAFLFPLARFPLPLLPVGLLAGARYALRVWRHGGGLAVREALRRLPSEIRTILPQRVAQPLSGTLGWLRLRHNPKHILKRSLSA